MMPHIHRGTRLTDVFESYAEGVSSLPVPSIVDQTNPYECKKQSIEDFNMKKRMYWCRSRRYRVKNSDDFDEEPGFFVAGSRYIKGRVFAFRPSYTGDGVRWVGQMDGVAVVRNQVLAPYFCTKNSISSSSVAPAPDGQ